MKLIKTNLKISNSTNDEAIKRIKKGKNNGIIITQIQRRGRGRYGKKWISIKGNLFMSIFFEIKEKSLLKKITKENCHLVKKSLSNLVKYKISIKPPNDLLIMGKKVCGILQETITYSKKKFIIIGIGVNIKKNPFIRNYPTTNLNKHAYIKLNRNIVFTNIRKTFEKRIGKI